EALEGELVEDEEPILVRRAGQGAVGPAIRVTQAGDEEGEGNGRGPADLAAELFEGELYRNAFDDEAHLVRAISFILGELAYDSMFDQSLTKALASYANAVADGATPRAAADAARVKYQNAVALPF
ncbi:MAG: hypothetical protein KDK05_30685, partial [Candidatus Competibacteraceae bacterium]|nr:hypothetical protein [Candidatus Competibacteraceae bacterium]